jgi:hypothetical protein
MDQKAQCLLENSEFKPQYLQKIIVKGRKIKRRYAG